MPLPNDTLFNLQWYLKNTGQAGGTAGIDINVEKVWADYTGTGIRIGIYDDSVQINHPDLIANYNAALQPVIGGVTHAGTPILATDNHGTPVAGIIVASGNNNLGVTGIAYGATFGTARFLGADGTLAQQLMDLQTNFDVTNHSWGSTRSYFADGDGNSYWQNAANVGRGGLGVIMVKAAGNERVGNPGGSEPVGRDANDSGANTNRYAIVVGATLNTGFVADYSSPSATLLVSAPAGPTNTGLDQDISTDRTGTDGYNNGTTGTPANQADYSSFNGTSAATPVTSGVAALILNANNTLGWRDVQEILAYSARQVGSAIGAAPAGSEADVWAYNAAKDWNGGGLHFSNDYGFGMVDALTAVRLAETWRVGSPTANTSANEQNTTATVTHAAQAIPNNNGQSITYTFNITGAIAIEQASLNLALNHTAVGDLRIVLTSPNGTASDIWRGTNANTAINTNWTFASREFYGDAANGTWTVTITDNGTLGTGTVGDATLTLFGSAKTADDTYVYTNEYAAIAGLGTRNTLTDTGGIDTLNAAAVTAAVTINLVAGSVNQIAGQNMTIGATTIIENAIGGDGNDIITGNASANSLWGARGNDTLDGGAGVDLLYGGAGDDIYIVDEFNDTIIEALNGGTDTIRSGQAQTFMISTNVENMELLAGGVTGWGNAGSNVMTGNDANNVFVSGDGDDTVNGGNGDDTLIGGAGADTLNGGNNNDQLWGGADNDTLNGGDGNDVIIAGAGTNTLTGGLGDDVYIVENGTDVLIEAAGAGTGNDTAWLFASGMTLADNIEVAVLVGNATTLNGGAGNETLLSNGGFASTINGGGGADTIWGSNFGDTQNGGTGNDTLIGLGGADTFVFNGPGFGFDVVNDFSGIAGGQNDRIDLRGMGVANFAALSFTQAGVGTTVNFGADGILLWNIVATNLQAGDFIFS